MEDKFDIKELGAGVAFLAVVFGIGYYLKSCARPTQTEMIRKVEQGKLEENLSIEQSKGVIALDLNYKHGNLRKSNLVLSQTKKIKGILEENGYEVVLFRDDKESKMNLYLNLHCDVSNPSPVENIRRIYNRKELAQAK